MFEKGDHIVYGNNGVCVVEEITRMQMKGIDCDKLYYRLTSVTNPGSKFFSPVDNDKVVMRRTMTKDEAEELIKGLPGLSPLPVPEDKFREELYKDVIRSCDPEKAFRIILTLYRKKMERFKQGKKNTSIDERYFKQIENNLYSELAFALGRDRSEINDYIKEKIG
ncbi:MAG: CarD family transcriptional regulator [Lachnospiraceae bacterium]|nr:CarD family transcriptional regulator [Lachnospiraceae bacterium]MBR6274130.1 CarD family transcriptional regulator [Lachnospiraceae bacterium]